MSRAAIIALTRKHGPMTAKQLASALSIQEGSLRTCLRRARAHGTKHIRIADWAGGIPKYGPGPEPDTEGGTTADRILQILEDGGRASVAKLAQRLGLETSVVDPAVRRLRAKPGKIHVVGWERRVGETGGREGAIYQVGPGVDAPRPDFSNSQREAERRRNERRRVQSVVNGGRTRSRRAATGPTAGPFDGLMR